MVFLRYLLVDRTLFLFGVKSSLLLQLCSIRPLCYLFFVHSLCLVAKLIVPYVPENLYPLLEKVLNTLDGL